MIGKITPLVEEAGNGTWLRAVALHTIGLVVSASMLGIVLGGIGAALGARQWGSLGVALWSSFSMLCAMSDLGLMRLALLSRQRQTPGSWKCVYGAEWGAFVWGLDLGQGWTVRVPFAAYFALISWAVLRADLVHATLVAAVYGLGKSLPVATARWLPSGKGVRGDLVATCLNLGPPATRIAGTATAILAALVLVAGFWP